MQLERWDCSGVMKDLNDQLQLRFVHDPHFHGRGSCGWSTLDLFPYLHPVQLFPGNWSFDHLQSEKPHIWRKPLPQRTYLYLLLLGVVVSFDHIVTFALSLLLFQAFSLSPFGSTILEPHLKQHKHMFTQDKHFDVDFFHCGQIPRRLYSSVASFYFCLAPSTYLPFFPVHQGPGFSPIFSTQSHSDGNCSESPFGSGQNSHRM